MEICSSRLRTITVLSQKYDTFNYVFQTLKSKQDDTEEDDTTEEETEDVVEEESQEDDVDDGTENDER